MPVSVHSSWAVRRKRKRRQLLTKGPSVPARTILLVEDDSELANAIKAELEGRGYLVRISSIADAVYLATTTDAAALILDRVVFGVDSLQSLAALRKQDVRIPVLMVSVPSSTEEIVQALRAGADQYLTKPFDMVELTARVEALLRRLGDVRSTKLSFGDLEMDLIEGLVLRGGIQVDLLPRERRLLEYFLRRPNQIVTRAMLLKDLWQHDLRTETNVVDVQISNLRKKIDLPGLPSRIANIRGIGFMLRKSQ